VAEIGIREFGIDVIAADVLRPDCLAPAVFISNRVVLGVKRAGARRRADRRGLDRAVVFRRAVSNREGHGRALNEEAADGIRERVVVRARAGQRRGQGVRAGGRFSRRIGGDAVPCGKAAVRETQRRLFRRAVIDGCAVLPDRRDGFARDGQRAADARAEGVVPSDISRAAHDAIALYRIRADADVRPAARDDRRQRIARDQNARREGEAGGRQRGAVVNLRPAVGRDDDGRRDRSDRKLALCDGDAVVFRLRPVAERKGKGVGARARVQAAAGDAVHRALAGREAVAAHGDAVIRERRAVVGLAVRRGRQGHGARRDGQRIAALRLLVVRIFRLELYADRAGVGDLRDIGAPGGSAVGAVAYGRAGGDVRPGRRAVGRAVVLCAVSRPGDGQSLRPFDGEAAVRDRDRVVAVGGIVRRENAGVGARILVGVRAAVRHRAEVALMHEARRRAGEGRIGVAVGLGSAVHRDRRGFFRDLQRIAARRGHIVAVLGLHADGQLPDVCNRRNRGRPRCSAVGAVADGRSGGYVRFGRRAVGRAVIGAGVVGAGDGQSLRPFDGEAAVRDRDRIVAVGGIVRREYAGVGARILGGIGAAVRHRAEIALVHEARHRAGEGRIGVAVSLGGAVHRDRRRLRGDRQRALGPGDRVVARLGAVAEGTGKCIAARALAELAARDVVCRALARYEAAAGFGHSAVRERRAVVDLAPRSGGQGHRALADGQGAVDAGAEGIVAGDVCLAAHDLMARHGIRAAARVGLCAGSDCRKLVARNQDAACKGIAAVGQGRSVIDLCPAVGCDDNFRCDRRNRQRALCVTEAVIGGYVRSAAVFDRHRRDAVVRRADVGDRSIAGDAENVVSRRKRIARRDGIARQRLAVIRSRRAARRQRDGFGFDGKGPRDRAGIVALAGDGDGRGAGVDVVAVGNRVIRVEDKRLARPAHRDLAVRHGEGRFLLRAVISRGFRLGDGDAAGVSRAAAEALRGDGQAALVFCQGVAVVRAALGENSVVSVLDDDAGDRVRLAADVRYGFESIFDGVARAEFRDRLHDALERSPVVDLRLCVRGDGNGQRRDGDDVVGGVVGLPARRDPAGIGAGLGDEGEAERPARRARHFLLIAQPLVADLAAQAVRRVERDRAAVVDLLILIRLSGARHRAPDRGRRAVSRALAAVQTVGGIGGDRRHGEAVIPRLGKMARKVDAGCRGIVRRVREGPIRVVRGIDGRVVELNPVFHGDEGVGADAVVLLRALYRVPREQAVGHRRGRAHRQAGRLGELRLADRERGSRRKVGVVVHRLGDRRPDVPGARVLRHGVCPAVCRGGGAVVLINNAAVLGVIGHTRLVPALSVSPAGKLRRRDKLRLLDHNGMICFRLQLIHRGDRHGLAVVDACRGHLAGHPVFVARGVFARRERHDVAAAVRHDGIGARAALLQIPLVSIGIAGGVETVARLGRGGDGDFRRIFRRVAEHGGIVYRRIAQRQRRRNRGQLQRHGDVRRRSESRGELRRGGDGAAGLGRRVDGERAAAGREGRRLIAGGVFQRRRNGRALARDHHVGRRAVDGNVGACRLTHRVGRELHGDVRGAFGHADVRRAVRDVRFTGIVLCGGQRGHLHGVCARAAGSHGFKEIAAQLVGRVDAVSLHGIGRAVFVKSDLVAADGHGADARGSGPCYGAGFLGIPLNGRRPKLRFAHGESARLVGDRIVAVRIAVTGRGNGVAADGVIRGVRGGAGKRAGQYAARLPVDKAAAGDGAGRRRTAVEDRLVVGGYGQGRARDVGFRRFLRACGERVSRGQIGIQGNREVHGFPAAPVLGVIEAADRDALPAYIVGKNAAVNDAVRRDFAACHRRRAVVGLGANGDAGDRKLVLRDGERGGHGPEGIVVGGEIGDNRHDRAGVDARSVRIGFAARRRQRPAHDAFRIAVPEAGADAGADGAAGYAVGQARGLRRDGDDRLVHGQGTGPEGDLIVAGGIAGRGDGIASRAARAGAVRVVGAGERGRSAEVVGGLAAGEAVEARGVIRRGVPVGDALVGRRDRQRYFGDGAAGTDREGIAGKRVVGVVDRYAADRDKVRLVGVLAVVDGGADGQVHRVAVDDARRAADRREHIVAAVDGRRRIGVIGLGDGRVRRGGRGKRTPGDGQFRRRLRRREAVAVAVVGAQAARVEDDVVGARGGLRRIFRRFAGRARLSDSIADAAGNNLFLRLTVFQAGIGRREYGDFAVDHRHVVARHGDGGAGDVGFCRHVAVLEIQRVVRGGRAAQLRGVHRDGDGLPCSDPLRVERAGNIRVRDGELVARYQAAERDMIRVDDGGNFAVVALVVRREAADRDGSFRNDVVGGQASNVIVVRHVRGALEDVYVPRRDGCRSGVGRAPVGLSPAGMRDAVDLREAVAADREFRGFMLRFVVNDAVRRRHDGRDRETARRDGIRTALRAEGIVIDVVRVAALQRGAGGIGARVDLAALHLEVVRDRRVGRVHADAQADRRGLFCSVVEESGRIAPRDGQPIRRDVAGEHQRVFVVKGVVEVLPARRFGDDPDMAERERSRAADVRIVERRVEIGDIQAHVALQEADDVVAAAVGEVVFVGSRRRNAAGHLPRAVVDSVVRALRRQRDRNRRDGDGHAARLVVIVRVAAADVIVDRIAARGRSVVFDVAVKGRRRRAGRVIFRGQRRLGVVDRPARGGILDLYGGADVRGAVVGSLVADGLDRHVGGRHGDVEGSGRHGRLPSVVVAGDLHVAPEGIGSADVSRGEDIRGGDRAVDGRRRAVFDSVPLVARHLVR